MSEESLPATDIERTKISVAMQKEILKESTPYRIRAYLAASLPLAGGVPSDGWHRGRALIERMALSCEGYDPPSVRLTLDQCADVLDFVRGSEPADAEAFYESWANPSPHVGLMFVLEVVMDHLRRAHSRANKSKRRSARETVGPTRNSA